MVLRVQFTWRYRLQPCPGLLQLSRCAQAAIGPRARAVGIRLHAGIQVGSPIRVASIGDMSPRENWIILGGGMCGPGRISGMSVVVAVVVMTGADPQEQ